MKKEPAGGTLLIAGAASGMVVMLLHPTAHGLMDSESGPHLARVNAMVHGLALAAMPMVFLGLLALWRRLERTDLATAALVAYGWGIIAVMTAAVASGFVAPAAIARIGAAGGSASSAGFLTYTGLWNQAFAKVNVVATSAGILLFSVGLLRGARTARGAGILGAIVGAMIPLLLFAGHLRLDVHGYGVIVFAQAAWQIWVGLLLCGEPAPERQAEPRSP